MNGRYALKASRMLGPKEEINDGVVAVDDGRIAYVGPARAEDGDVVDLGEAIVAPGFIDLHVHGNGGDWWGQSHESDLQIARRMAAGGTTNCLASLGGRRAFEEVLGAIRTTAGIVGSTSDGVDVLGIHMEGPFISVEKKGAWMPKQLRRPDIAELEAMQEAAGGAIKVMTIAPELPGALEVASRASRLGIRPAIGHTNATYEEALAGIEAGMTMATHTFNGMRGLHHRDPGALGAILASPEVDAELIADGQHVARGAIEVLLAAKGADRVILVTDNVALAGMEPGEYGEGHWRVKVSESGVTLADGTIAGSVLPFNRHLAHMSSICSLSKASKMASRSPARAIGFDSRKGSLTPGYDADLVVLSPELDVRMTIVGGRIVYSNPTHDVPARLAQVG